MRQVQPPRDWVSHAAGLGAATLLLAGLGYAFAGPATHLVVKPLSEVWVTIIRPVPTPPPADPGPAPRYTPRPR